MTTPGFLRWCPECQRATENAPLPQMATDGRQLCLLRAGAPQAYRRRLYCLSCSHIWTSVEVPEHFVHDLLSKDLELEQLRRELAMAKLLLAKDQQGSAATAKKKPQKLKLHRAA